MAEAIRNAIELNIYNDELEVVKTYQTYGIRWKAFKKIMSLQDEIDSMENAKDDTNISLMGDILKLVFPNLSEADLEEAFTDDLFNCCMQAVNVAKRMAKNS